ncbi:hypothetical protein [Comamonas sp. UBA7528]|nr:hypothetical protein [Comamonas sp. UBA7528]
MIVIVSTPLRILASYALVFAVGAAVGRQWRSGNPIDRSNLGR